MKSSAFNGCDLPIPSLLNSLIWNLQQSPVDGPRSVSVSSIKVKLLPSFCFVAILSSEATEKHFHWFFFCSFVFSRAGEEVVLLSTAATPTSKLLFQVEKPVFYCSPCLAPGPGDGSVSSEMDDVERSRAQVIRRVSHSPGQSCCLETLQRDARTCSRCVQGVPGEALRACSAKGWERTQPSLEALMKDWADLQWGCNHHAGNIKDNDFI